MPKQRIRAILAQRPGSGEKRVRKIPAREGSAALGRRQEQLLHNVPRWKKRGRTRSWPGRKHGPPERSESDSRTALSVLCTSNFVLCSIHRP